MSVRCAAVSPMTRGWYFAYMCVKSSTSDLRVCPVPPQNVQATFAICARASIVRRNNVNSSMPICR